jgi:phosphatidyl-myo-inositol dimannoside synthase
MIIGLFPSLASVGGVQMAGRQTAAALTLIAGDRDWRYAFLSLNDDRGEHDASIGGLKFDFHGFARRKGEFLFKALQVARENPKVIFAAHPNLAPIAGMMKTVSPDARTIAGAHGIEIWQPLSVVRRKALRRAEIVTVPSSDTARRLASIQDVPEEKIRILPWPLDPEFAEFARDCGQLSLPVGFPPGQVVLSVGRWAANERYKGGDLLIQAAAKLSQSFPELHLVLVGGGDDLPRLKELAQSTAASERIHFLPGISRAELAACYARAEIFALPSTGEGFGLVFLEAMAFGKPVIGTNMGGIPDVVKNEREGLLVEPTVEAVRSGLRRLLSEPKLREELGARGRNRVNTDFTFDSFQHRLRAILNEII